VFEQFTEEMLRYRNNSKNKKYYRDSFHFSSPENYHYKNSLLPFL